MLIFSFSYYATLFLVSIMLQSSPKFAYYAETISIISWRSKLVTVCSNNYFTPHWMTSLLHHQSKTRVLGSISRLHDHVLFLSYHVRTVSLGPRHGDKILHCLRLATTGRRLRTIYTWSEDKTTSLPRTLCPKSTYYSHIILNAISPA